ncbi:18773_t:CDS:10 [Rhizophagus irregularis]|nr:18773_t:CDS:10 [Rhizophagus irregularis]
MSKLVKKKYTQPETQSTFISDGQTTSIQDLKNQLEIMNKQNKDLLRRLKQSQQQNQDSTDENQSRRSSIASVEDIESQSHLSPCTSFLNQSSIIQSSFKDQPVQPSLPIAKPRGNLAKNVRKALNLTRREYQGYRFKQKNPTFPNCANDWAIKEIIRAIINNKREYSRNKKNYKDQEQDDEIDEMQSEKHIQQNSEDLENMHDEIEPNEDVNERDQNFWLSEEPEHLMNAYLILYPEAQDELIDFLADKRGIGVKQPKDNPVSDMKGKRSIGFIQDKKRMKRSDNNQKQKKIRREGDKNDNDASDFFEQKSRRSATKKVIERSIVEYEKMLKIQEKHTECNILRENNFNFIQILNQQSEILLGKSKDWKLIRGDFNNRFNKISSKIEVKNLIDDLSVIEDNLIFY